MCEHVKLKGKVVCHGAREIFLGGYLVVEIIESMQPLVLCFNSCFHAETAFGSGASEPDIEQVLAFVFGRRRFYQSHMLADLIAVVLKIYKLAFVGFRVRCVRRKDSDAGIGSYSVEGLFIERDYTFESMVLKYGCFDILFLFGFARDSRLRYDNDTSCFGRKAVKQMFGKGYFVQVGILL